jgi:hypothetical protein
LRISICEIRRIDENLLKISSSSMIVLVLARLEPLVAAFFQATAHPGQWRPQIMRNVVGNLPHGLHQPLQYDRALN